MIAIYLWTLIERFGANAISFLGYIALARLLSPSDFGVIGIVLMFSSFATSLIDSGLPDGLIKKENVSYKDYHTIFFFNLMIGIVVATIFWLCSSLIAKFFHLEELRDVMKVIGVCVVLQSLVVVPLTKLRKELQQKTITQITLLTTLVSMIFSIIYASIYHSYWALVLQQLTYSLLLMIFVYISSKWKIKFFFDWSIWKEHARFGSNLLLNYIILQVSENLNTFFIGKYYSPTSLGYYTQAQKMQRIPVTSLEASFSWSMFITVAACTDRDSKKALLINSFSKYIFINLLMVSILMICSSFIFTYIFGDQWLNSIILFRLLLLVSIFIPVSKFVMTSYKLFSLESYIWKISLIEVSTMFSIIVLMYQYGIEYILGATIINAAIFCTINLLIASNKIFQHNLMLKAYLKDLLMFLTITAVSFLITLLPLPLFIETVLQLFVFFLLLIFTATFTHHETYLNLISFAKKKLLTLMKNKNGIKDL